MKRRSHVALTADEQAAFLDEVRLAALSTVDQGGFPHVVAMIFVARENAIFMTSWAKAQKVLNIRRNPKVGILIEDGATYADFRGISIRGTAEIIDDPVQVREMVLAIFARQAGSANSEAPVGAFDHLEKRVVLKITPDHVASWDHRKLAGRY